MGCLAQETILDRSAPHQTQSPDGTPKSDATAACEGVAPQTNVEQVQAKSTLPKHLATTIKVLALLQQTGGATRLTSHSLPLTWPDQRRELGLS